MKRSLGVARRVLAAPLLAPIAVYRRVISPALPRRCRYEPTCSAYAEQAIRELGPLRGTILALWRLLRCNPFSPGGFDPLAARRLFRDERPAGPPAHGEADAEAGEPAEAGAQGVAA